jgi:pSer/pThr/pTyr-binding forkhead associated (FHA) protein
MPITVIVRSMAGDEPRLIFDGTQRVVIGRGAGSDVRVPDPSVSHRHASLRSQGAEFIVVDEGSTNGTFVGDVRVAARMSRIVRSGDWVRVGRVWLRLRIDQSPATRDLAMATRDLALAFVAHALQARGVDRTPAVRVVEGEDQGMTLGLVDDARGYTVGRGPHCEMALADPDVSREHVRVLRTGAAVFVEDLSAKNGSWLGAARLPSDARVAWRAPQVLKVGRTVLALVEPVADALAEIESAPDEPLEPEEVGASIQPAPQTTPQRGEGSGNLGSDPLASLAEGGGAKTALGRRGTWSLLDLLVMGAALGVLALSLAGIFWLLRGASATPGR